MIWLLLAIALLLSVPFRLLSLPGLSVATWLKAKLEELS